MQEIIKKLKTMDKKIIRLVNLMQCIFFMISVLGIIILLIHYKLYISAELYFVGIEIFKIGIIGAISVVLCSSTLWIIKSKMK